ncbi:MAG TPA: penicillin-binding protein 2 [bacterium]|nr:penicillin-binding protein 2 [bacterium]HNZ51142.1 penicillin-binding protein 2 [bacterium]
MAQSGRLISRRNRSGVVQSGKRLNSNFNIVFAAFVLVGLVIIGRLFWLQLIKHNYYLTKARDQHEFNVQLAPTRGQIFVHNNSAVAGSELYPIATNRRFFTLYAVPNDLQTESLAKLRQHQAETQSKNNQILSIILEPSELAEILFESFDQPMILAEIDKIENDRLKQQLDDQLNQLPAASSTDELAAAKEAILKRQTELLADPFYQEMSKMRRETAIKEKSEAKVKEYLNILNKGADPYEVVAKKLESAQILKIYFKVLSRQQGEAAVKPDDLSISGETVVWQPAGQAKPTTITINGLGQSGRNYRYYPEKNIGANMLGFVSLENDDDLIGRGQYGLEGAFDDILMGRAGSMKGERSANKATILQGRDYQQQTNGSDLILTIDRSIQNIACSKLLATVAKHQADSGSVIIINPKTGAILAMCSAPDFDPNNFQSVKDLRQFNNQPTFEAYEPGSIFKAITMAIGIDQGKVTPQTTYNDAGSVMVGKNKINNSDFKGRGVVNMVRVLQDSLNTGMVFVLNRLGIDTFRDSLKKFGFGQPTGIELDSESSGNLNNLYRKFGQEINAATASFGQGINVTTLQMAMAFGVLANEGKLMKPYLVEEIVAPDGSRIKAEPQVVEQVISPQAARTVSGMLVNVVEDGHGKKAGVDGYYVAGKTGTAQVPSKDGRGYLANINIGSFAGYAPVEDPIFVMVVRIDHPRGVVWAESSAAPLFGEIANFILKYKQVPAQRPAK